MLRAAPEWLPSGLARTLGLLGLGMLIWAGISTALLQGRGDALLSLRPLQYRALGGAAALLAVLGAQLWLQSASLRAQWRARALATLAVALLADIVLLVLLSADQRSPGLVSIFGVIACIAALASVCLVTLAWATPRSQWLLPAQLALALLGGAAVFFSLMAWLWPGDMGAGSAVSSLLLLTGIAAALLLATWLGEGGLLPLARHRLRWIALGLLVAAPLLLKGWLLLGSNLPRGVWWLAALAVAAAVLLESRQPRAALGEG